MVSGAVGAESLRDSLFAWYARHPREASLLREILKGRVKGVSLRALDYLVTNYAKALNVCIPRADGLGFCIHREYKSQLRGFGKRLFDPFARRSRVTMPLPGSAPIDSTVAQLSFFRWAIKNGVVDYAQQHASDIDRHMILKISANKNAPSQPEATLASKKSGHEDGGVLKLV